MRAELLAERFPQRVSRAVVRAELIMERFPQPVSRASMRAGEP
jgi:hypothetical protein